MHGAGIAYPFGAPEFTQFVGGVRVAIKSLVFCGVTDDVVSNFYTNFSYIFHFLSKCNIMFVREKRWSDAVDRGFEPRSGQIKAFSAKHAALTRKSKDWLARNQE